MLIMYNENNKNQQIQQNEIPPCDPFIVIRCFFITVMDKYKYIYRVPRSALLNLNNLFSHGLIVQLFLDVLGLKSRAITNVIQGMHSSQIAHRVTHLFCHPFRHFPGLYVPVPVYLNASPFYFPYLNVVPNQLVRKI